MRDRESIADNCGIWGTRPECRIEGHQVSRCWCCSAARVDFSAQIFLRHEMTIDRRSYFRSKKMKTPSRKNWSKQPPKNFVATPFTVSRQSLGSKARCHGAPEIVTQIIRRSNRQTHHEWHPDSRSWRGIQQRLSRVT